MANFFDELNDFLADLLHSRPTASADKFTDPYMQEAWDELEDFLQDRQPATGPNSWSNRQQPAKSPRQIDQELLITDYKNLEVPFGAPFPEVKKAYKRILMEYHPDRHQGNPEKLRIATEITKKVNLSLLRIKKFEEIYGNS